MPFVQKNPLDYDFPAWRVAGHGISVSDVNPRKRRSQPLSVQFGPLPVIKKDSFANRNVLPLKILNNWCVRAAVSKRAQELALLNGEAAADCSHNSTTRKFTKQTVKLAMPDCRVFDLNYVKSNHGIGCYSRGAHKRELTY